MEYSEIIAYLLRYQDLKFQQFQKKLIFTDSIVIGVKMDVVKQLAKELSTETNYLWKNIPSGKYFETDLLKGLLISYAKIPIDDKLNELAEFAMTIDNWAVCDTIVCSTKFKSSDSNKLFAFCKTLMDKEHVFAKRVAVIFFLKYFANDKIDEISEVLFSQQYGDYYFDMAVSWYYSVALVYNFEKILDKIAQIRLLSEFVYQKSLQKAIESRRITLEQKEILRKYKKLICE